MITFAKKSDEEKIIQLWHNTFGDSRQYIENFLCKCASVENALVYRIEDEIVSMMFLIPCELVVTDKKYHSLYIYAACTAENQRNKGYMSKLIEYAKNIENNIDFLALSPADNKLYSFYEKLGFQRAFKEKVVIIERRLLNFLANSEDIETDENISFENLRNNVFGSWDYICWNQPMIEYAIKESSFSIVRSYGYLLYKETNGKCTVTEICSEKDSFGKLIKNLLDETSYETFEFILPVLYPLTQKNECFRDSGMLYPTSDVAKEIFSFVKTAYIGFKFD